MSAMSDLDLRLQELAGRAYDDLEDQLYDPDPAVDGYDKAGQRRHVLSLLKDLARNAAGLVLRDLDRAASAKKTEKVCEGEQS